MGGAASSNHILGRTSYNGKGFIWLGFDKNIPDFEKLINNMDRKNKVIIEFPRDEEKDFNSQLTQQIPEIRKRLKKLEENVKNKKIVNMEQTNALRIIDDEKSYSSNYDLGKTIRDLERKIQQKLENEIGDTKVTKKIQQRISMAKTGTSNFLKNYANSGDAAIVCYLHDVFIGIDLFINSITTLKKARNRNQEDFNKIIFYSTDAHVLAVKDIVSVIYKMTNIPDEVVTSPRKSYRKPRKSRR